MFSIVSLGCGSLCFNVSGERTPLVGGLQDCRFSYPTMFVIPLLSTTKLRFLAGEVLGKVFPVTGRTKLVEIEEI
jgi:hypothetical protein